jgi:hypothetical protein
MAADTERSFGAVLGDIVGHIQQIVRAEIRLAKAEVREELTKIKFGATLLLTGAIAGVLALGVLLLSAVYGLATVLAPWMAALLVALITAALGGVCLAAGVKAMKAVTLRPKKTAETLQETMQWAKTRAR